MAEPRFARVECPAQFKKMSLSATSSGLNYVLWFEVGYDRASPFGDLFKRKVPLTAEWLPEGQDEIFPLGAVTALKPSSLSTDADGEVRFKVSFSLPASAVPSSIGVLAAGLHDFPADGPIGRLTIEAQQAEMFGD